jgi:hypothetical protein
MEIVTFYKCSAYVSSADAYYDFPILVDHLGYFQRPEEATASYEKACEEHRRVRTGNVSALEYSMEALPFPVLKAVINGKARYFNLAKLEIDPPPSQ